MNQNVKTKHDVFAMSLGGITTVTAFCNAPVIAPERLQKREMSVARRPRLLNWRLWMPRRHRVV